jgi:hypothetical protein
MSGFPRRLGDREHTLVGRPLDAAADRVAVRAALAARWPSGRPVRGDEIAQTTSSPAGSSASPTSGTAFVVCGGMEGLRPRPWNQSLKEQK